MLIAALLLMQAVADGPVSTNAPAGDPGVIAPTPLLLTHAPEPVAAAPGEPEKQIFVSPMGEPFRADAGQPYPVAAWFARADADADGALSLDEFVNDARAFFRVLDKNGDGVIDGFEDADYENAVAPEVASQGLIAGVSKRDRKRIEPAGAARFGLLPEPQPLRAADGDLDFRITAAEFDKAAAARFATLDADHDGKLGKAELPETWEQRRLAKAAEKAAKDKP